MQNANKMVSGVDPDSSSADVGFELLEEIDVGVAFFDSELSLVRCNARYRELCGYSQTLASPGIGLQALIRHSLEAVDLPAGDIETTITTSLLRLKTDKPHRFGFRTAGNRHIAISRRRLGDGSIVETVSEGAAQASVDARGNSLQHLADLAHTRMMHALDAIGDAFSLWDPRGRLVFYNQKYVEFNPHIEDIIRPGVMYEDLVTKAVERGALNGAEGGPNETVAQELERHFNPGPAFDRPLVDGRWLRIYKRRTEEGEIVSVSSDITELKNREIEVKDISGVLDATSGQLDAALNNMIQGLCMFDSEQRLVLCNRQYLEMYGFSPDVVKPGILLSDVMRYSISLGNYKDEDAEAALNARHDPKKLRKRSTIKQYLRDGRVMAVMNQPLANGGSVATYQDITKMERHEARLVAYNKKLYRSNQELQDFAYVASHDLQEPLRKIEAFGDRLVRKHGELLPEDGRMFVDRMQNAAGRMRRLINDLLGYSRVTTKAKPFESVDLGTVVDEVVSDMQIRIQETGATIRHEGLPQLEADPVQMQQLFQNLISNSLKFCVPERAPVITITAKSGRKENEIGEETDFWHIELADNGIGFDNQYKDQIFTMFQRLHGRLEYEGTGIGLATCRKIIDRHNGSIDAEGQPDVGATFMIDLPSVQPTEESEQ